MVDLHKGENVRDVNLDLRFDTSYMKPFARQPVRLSLSCIINIEIFRRTGKTQLLDVTAPFSVVKGKMEARQLSDSVN